MMVRVLLVCVTACAAFAPASPPHRRASIRKFKSIPETPPPTARFVRFDETSNDKPKLLVFGGVDGTDRVGIGNRRRLSEFYDVRSLVLDADDVADHGALVRLAVAEAGGDAVSVVGESMGAVIALRGVS